MENPFTDLPPVLFELMTGGFEGHEHPHTHKIRFMEFVAVGLVNAGRVHGHPVVFPDFLEG